MGVKGGLIHLTFDPEKQLKAYTMRHYKSKGANKVRVHSSTTSNETMSDKIKRMLKNEVSQM